MKSILKKHYIAVVFALIVGAIYVAPHIVFELSQYDNAIHFAPLDAESHYLASVNEVAEGYDSYTSTFLYEYKNSSLQNMPTGAWLFGVLKRVMGLDIKTLYISIQFLFPLISFILWYWLSYLITKNRLWSILSGLLVLLGFHVLEYINITRYIHILLGQADMNLLLYSRFINPVATFPFFFAGLVSAYYLFVQPIRKHALWFGLLLGINMYLYAFFWAALGILAACIGIYWLIQKQWKAIISLILSGVISIIVGAKVFYTILFTSSSTETAFDMLGITFPFVHHRILNWSDILMGAIVLCVVYLFVSYKKERAISLQVRFVGLLVCTAIIAVNQQMVSGIAVEPGHFHWYVVIPITFLVITVCAQRIIETYISNDTVQKGMGIIGIIGIVWFGIGTQVSGYTAQAASFAEYHQYVPILSWLQEHTEPESVVLASMDLSDWIPAYTHNNVYMAPHAVYYESYPLERRLHNVAVYYYLHYRDDSVLTGMKNRKSELGRVALPLVYYRDLCGSYDCYPDSIVDSMVTYYENVSHEDFETWLKKYRIDYIVWDTQNNSEWNIVSNTTVVFETEIGPFKIFHIE